MNIDINIHALKLCKLITCIRDKIPYYRELLIYPEHLQGFLEILIDLSPPQWQHKGNNVY